MMQVAQMQRSLLLIMAIGLIPIALSYGAAPQTSLPWLFGIDADGVATRHVFRAIMGLYLAMVCFWSAGAVFLRLRLPALWSLFVFTLGIALGRGLSLLVDGWPGFILFAYLLAEVVVAAAAAWLIFRDGGRHAGV